MLLFSSLVLLCVKFSFTFNTIPVFLIDNGLVDLVKTEKNPFKLTTFNDFEAITNQVANLSINIILFIEEMFSIEDVSSKDNQGTPYVHLHKYFSENKAKYFPNVVEPYKIIEKRFDSFGHNTFHLRNTVTRLHLDENYKFTYIYFEDGRNETRVQTLRRHDATMREILFSIKHLVKGPVTAIYTGVRNPIVMNPDRRTMDMPKATEVKEAPRSIVKGWLTVQCGNGTFRFYDCKLVNGFDARMMPRRCFKTNHGVDIFTYTVVFDSLKYAEVLKTYNLVFHFTHQDNPAIGWKLNQIQWTKTDSFELGKIVLSASHRWDDFYHNHRPMSITPTEWFHPTLVLTSFKIQITAKNEVVITETTPGEIEETTIEVSPSSTSSGSSSSLDSSASIDSSASTSSLKPTTKYVDWEIVATSTQGPPSDRKRPLNFIMSPGLFSAIMISVILLSILGWGLNMLSYVQGNDKLDSLEKKSLSVADIID